MADSSIPKQVLNNLGQIVEETGKEAVKQTLKVTDSVITGKELLGDIKPLSEEELAQKKAEDERKKQEEMAALGRPQQEPGRNVEAEIEQVREAKNKEEEEQEKFLEQIKQQREAEEQEKQQLVAEGNNQRTLAKMRMMPQGKKKSMPDQTQMSQTSEFKGKID